jgi:aminomethyltransferase
MTGSLRFTPFHGRAAAANTGNRWTARNGFTLAADYGDAVQEGTAARTRVVITDISWRWRIFLKGARAGEVVSRVFTRNAAGLHAGRALKALWLNDGGAVRGAGVVARYASDSFLVGAAAKDTVWFASAASLLGVDLNDVTEEEGGLAIIGPYADAVLKAAVVDAELAPLAFRKLFWRGLDITLSRWGEQNGYEIWCAADDCYLVWDRLMRAGAPFGIAPMGVSASDVLDVEAGVPRPARDYRSAENGLALDPSPESLGMDSLIDETHLLFNGRAAWLRNRATVKSTLIGVEIDSETPAPFATLIRNGASVGRTLLSVYSPQLRRAIALAQVEKSHCAPGTAFTLTVPGSLDLPQKRDVTARAVKLPFLDSPAPASTTG